MVCILSQSQKVLSASASKSALSQNQKGSETTEFDAAVRWFAEAKLCLSMPKDAQYPSAWALRLKTMKSDTLMQVVEVLCENGQLSAERYGAGARACVEHIQQQNRAQAKERKQAEKLGTATKDGEAALELTESVKAEQLVLLARRQELRCALKTLLEEESPRERQSRYLA